MQYDRTCDPERGWLEAPASHALIIPSHGEGLFGRCLIPAIRRQGQCFPAVIFCHGFPGIEQNIDLAQDLRRAGFVVITFSYRGVWGSHGYFSFSHVVEDVQEVVRFVRQGGAEAPIDPERIFLFGHSMGGFAVLNALADGLDVPKALLLAPWDLSAEYFSDPAAFGAMVSDTEDGYFRLETPDALEADTIAHANQWHFPKLACRLPRQTAYAFIGGLRDTDTPPEQNIEPLLGELKKEGFAVSYEQLDDCHTFDASRLQLADRMISFLRSEN